MEQRNEFIDVVLTITEASMFSSSFNSDLYFRAGVVAELAVFAMARQYTYLVYP